MRLNSDNPETDRRTRVRLLEAAGEVFAVRGFRCATIRDICRKARANVAAVHYHFGDKEELYAAVLKHTFKTAMEKHPLPEPVGPPEDQLYRHVLGILRRIHDEGQPSWHGKLLAREMAEPTKALDKLVPQIQTNHERLCAIIRQMFGRKVPTETARRCAFSVSGQCVFYFYCKSLVTRLMPEHSWDLERLARHITQFSINGIKGYRA